MTFLGWLSDPFKGLSNLQLGDEKGTLNHLVDDVSLSFLLFISKNTIYEVEKTLSLKLQE